MFRAEDIGRGNRLRFDGDKILYYSKNKDASNKYVFVTKDGTDRIFKKAISKIIQLDNKKLNEVVRMQQLAGLNEIKVNKPSFTDEDLIKLYDKIEEYINENWDFENEDHDYSITLLDNKLMEIMKAYDRDYATGYDKIESILPIITSKQKIDLYNKLKQLDPY